MQNVMTYCSRNKLQLTAGCDANAHCLVWGSTSISPKTATLCGYLVSTNLIILNKCTDPIFVISNTKEVIDLTLQIGRIGDMDQVSNWHVADKASVGSQVSTFSVT